MLDEALVPLFDTDHGMALTQHTRPTSLDGACLGAYIRANLPTLSSAGLLFVRLHIWLVVRLACNHRGELETHASTKVRQVPTLCHSKHDNKARKVIVLDDSLSKVIDRRWVAG